MERRRHSTTAAGPAKQPRRYPDLRSARRSDRRIRCLLAGDGSWTIGQGGRLTDLGSLLFVGPLLVVTAGLIAGPRPGLRRFFEEPVTVALSPEGLAVHGGGLAELVITWDAVGGISVVGTGQAATHVLDVTGKELVALPARFDAISTRRRTTLPELTLAMRPDRYRPLDERRPQRGCLLREVP